MTEHTNDLPEDDVPVLAPPSPVGTELRLAREAAGKSVADVAAELKLGTRQIEALEDGDWNALPGATFVRGIVRNYARAVGVDPAPLLARVALPEERANLHALPEERSSPVSIGVVGRRERYFVLGGLASVVVAGLIYAFMPDDLDGLRDQMQAMIDAVSRKEDAPPPAAPQQEPLFPPGTTPQQVLTPQAVSPGEAPATPAGTPAAPAPAVEPTLAPPQLTSERGAAGAVSSMLVVNADKMSWIEVRDRDNKIVFSQRLAAGSQQSIPGSGPLNITIGYAPGVRLSWRGEAIDLQPHTRGDVARLVLE